MSQDYSNKDNLSQNSFAHSEEDKPAERTALEREDASGVSQDDKSDFFNELKEKERKEGLATRGKGHNWTTFIEFLLGDW